MPRPSLPQIALNTRLCTRSNPPKLHPTFSTTPGRRKTILRSSGRFPAQRNTPVLYRSLSTAHRSPSTPPPQSSPTRPQPQRPQHHPTDAELAAAAAASEDLAFSTLAFTTSLVNSGNPIYSSDFENNNTTPASPSADAPSPTPFHPAPDFLPLPFTTSIANTGDPIAEFDIHPLEPTLFKSLDSDATPTSTPTLANTSPSTQQRHPTDPSLSASASFDSTSTVRLSTSLISSLDTAAMSDADYERFLEGRSGSSSGVESQSQSKHTKGGFTTSSVDTEVPAPLQGIKATYISESDEDFEAVSLSLEDQKPGKSVDLDTFKTLTSHKSAEEIDTKTFDPRGEHEAVVDKVREAGNGNVSCFRVELKGARVEYWVLSVDEKDGRVVGVRVGAVES